MSELKVVAFRAFNAPVLTSAMHKLRYRVFKERLDWSVSVVGDMEIDTYDACDPVYLALVGGNREVLGGVRLLPTTGPNMLANTFPSLLGAQPAPATPQLWESSRFCVDTQRATELLPCGLRFATPALFAGMVEAGLAFGLRAIVTVTDARMERILQRSGWPLARYAAPQQIGSTLAVAGELDVSPDALAQIRQKGGLEGPVLLNETQTRVEAAAA